MQTITMTSRGYVTIPYAIRKRLKLKPGSRVCVIEKDDGTIFLTPWTRGKRVLK